MRTKQSQAFCRVNISAVKLTKYVNRKYYVYSKIRLIHQNYPQKLDIEKTITITVNFDCN